MPRRPRVFVEGGIYHVYNRFARGAELFADPEEAIEFLEILRKARDRDVRGHNADGEEVPPVELPSAVPRTQKSCISRFRAL